MIPPPPLTFRGVEGRLTALDVDPLITVGSILSEKNGHILGFQAAQITVKFAEGASVDALAVDYDFDHGRPAIQLRCR